MKSLLLSLLGSIVVLAQAAEPPAAESPIVLPAQARLSFEQVRLPGDERMGLLGTSYLLGVGKGFAVGPAVYGAAAGQRGGFFAVGAEAAWYHRVAGPLWFETGVYVGGGGGGSAPVGGGLMLRPHADLMWDFGGFAAGLSASQVRFPSGRIDSRQLGLVFSLPTDFRQVEPDGTGASPSISGHSGMGFDRIQVVLGVYKPRSGSRRNSGGALTQEISFAGMRFERAFDGSSYWGLETAGAATGGVGGYAEYLAVLGTEIALGRTLTLGARGALGMGGGGDVGVGGGLLMKGGLYGTLRLSRSLGLSIEGGLTRAPQGSFKALHGAASLVWVLDDPSDPAAPTHSVRTEWVGGAEHYDAARRDGTVRDLQLNVLKVNRFVTPSIYLTGQAHSAWGGGAGGYIAGLFGAGVQARLFSRVHAGAEATVGAAGGGGIDTQGGALVQPMAYLGLDVSRQLSLRVGAGRIKALRGALDAKVMEASVVFTFGVLAHGDR